MSKGKNGVFLTLEEKTGRYCVGNDMPSILSIGYTKEYEKRFFFLISISSKLLV